MNILIVEDDSALAGDLAQRLQASGHNVNVADTLASAQELAQQHAPDIVVLDRLLPDGDGLDLIPWLREHHPATAVLVLSALVALDARVDGLNAGADDYLGKPYAFEELLARIIALKRRSANTATQLHMGKITLDRLSRTANADDTDLKLNPREFALLEYLMLHGGEPVTRAMILRDVWGYSIKPATNVLDVHVSRLRAKLEECGCAGMLVTERGVGYRLDDSEE
ncbi:MAG: response regulator transcription factor [Gammaproteobacteria bacterium]